MRKKELLNSIENPDAQLAMEAQAGNVDAEETLIRKYSSLVISKTKAYFMAGADSNDLIQEGMIGLMRAVRRFDVKRETNFAAFADRCITNQIISAIRSADRIKHKPLNTSDSLSRPISREQAEGGYAGEVTLGDTISANLADTPEEMLIMKDVTYYILNNGDNVFSDMEMQVLGETLKGYSYDQVAARLGKSRKAVDNALQRIKRKINNYLWK